MALSSVFRGRLRSMSSVVDVCPNVCWALPAWLSPEHHEQHVCERSEKVTVVVAAVVVAAVPVVLAAHHMPTSGKNLHKKISKSIS